MAATGGRRRPTAGESRSHPGPLDPIAPRTVTDAVAEQIRGLIVAGEFAPGDRLPAERELAQRLRVGRGAVREALRELRTSGLLVTNRGRGGTVVASIPHPHLEETFAELHATGAEHVFDLMELRMGLEAQTAFLAARRADLGDLKSLAALATHPDAAVSPEEDAAFHLGIARATGNPLLVRALEELVDLLHGRLPVMFRTLLSQPSDAATVRDQHRAVLDAIRGGHETHARDAMLHHLEFVNRTLAQLLGTGPSIRMVVSDIDGTLLSGPRRISARTRRAVASVRDAGVPVVLASSRPPRSIRFYHETLGLSTPVIAGNGALLWDLQAGIPISRISLDGDTASEAVAVGRALGAAANIESDDDWFADRMTDAARETLGRQGAAPPTSVGTVDAILEQGEPVDKVFLDLRDLSVDQQEAARATVLRSFATRATITETVPGLVELISPEASKAVMAQRMARTLGVPAEQVFAIGDHDNDEALLRWAGVGVAMGNGTAAAKAAADAVTSSNLRDGVAEALERWVLSAVPTDGARLSDAAQGEAPA